MDLGSLGLRLDFTMGPAGPLDSASASGGQVAWIYPLYVCALAAVIAGSSAASFLRCRFGNHSRRPAADDRALTRRLIDFSVGLAGVSEADAIARRLAVALREALGAYGAAVFVAGGAGTLRLAAAEGAIGVPEEIDGVPESLCSGALPAGGRITALGAVAGGEPAPVAWFPLSSAGEILGAVALGSPGGGCELGASWVGYVDAFAAQAATAMRAAMGAQEAVRQRAAMEAIERRIAAERAGVRVEAHRPANVPYIIGASSALRRGICVVERAAPSEVSILVTGETGTGKELIARAIHELSPRRGGPLVSVNCPAIPAPLAESELFGHERGAFTDAVAARPGKFELAHGGTIFLDEVGDLPLEVQAKLLRVLQERECQRVGGSATRKLDIRVVAATNRDLRAEARAGRFREDLFYRLAAVEIDVPPLRERTGDIPMLATHFLERAAAARGRRLSGFTPDAMAALAGYHWPGNVRELQNVVERAALLCAEDVVRPAHLDLLAAPVEQAPKFAATMRQEKTRRIQDALQHTGGNQAAAARLLGISRSNLARTMKSLGIWQPRRPPLPASGNRYDRERRLASRAHD